MRTSSMTTNRARADAAGIDGGTGALRTRVRRHIGALSFEAGVAEGRRTTSAIADVPGVRRRRRKMTATHNRIFRR